MQGPKKSDSWTATITGAFITSAQASDMLDVKLSDGFFSEVVGEKRNKFIVRSVPDSFLFKLKTPQANTVNKAYLSPVFYLGLEEGKKSTLNHFVEYTFEAFVHENKTVKDYCLGAFNPDTLVLECVEDLQTVSAKGGLHKLRAKSTKMNTYFAIVPKNYIFVPDGGEDVSVFLDPTKVPASPKAETNTQPKEMEKAVESEAPQKRDLEGDQSSSSSSSSSSTFSSSTSFPAFLDLEHLQEFLDKTDLAVPALAALGVFILTFLVLRCATRGKKTNEKKKK